MFRIKQLVTAAAVVLVAGSAMASNFRAADQVYLPVAGHINASGGIFVSDVTVSNVTSDPVTVSVIYTPTTNLAGARQTPQYFNDLFTLQPFERRDFLDFLGTAQSSGGLGLSSAFGTLVFNACRQGSATGCRSGQDEFGDHPDYRDIAVFSRIYFAGPNVNTAGTTGQALAGIPWYNYVSQEASDAVLGNLGTVSINGFRQTGVGGQAGTQRGNIGVMNASQYSTTTLRLRLFQGTNTSPISTRDVTLAPLNHVQGSLSDIFNSPAAPVGPSAVGLYVTVEQVNSIPEPGAAEAGCDTGCPGFLAYGAVLDNLSGDGTTLEAIYNVSLEDALDAIYGSSAGKPRVRRAVKR